MYISIAIFLSIYHNLPIYLSVSVEEKVCEKQREITLKQSSTNFKNFIEYKNNLGLLLKETSFTQKKSSYQKIFIKHKRIELC